LRIAEGYANHHPMTVQDIIRHITERYRETMDTNSIRHMLARDPRVKPYSGLLMEDRRFQIAAEDITAYFAGLSEEIDGIPAHFVSNMDEMGH
jgi:hypothetical protein